DEQLGGGSIATKGTGPNSGGHKESPLPVPAIAGGAAGGVVFLALLAALTFFLLRRRSRKHNAHAAVHIEQRYSSKVKPQEVTIPWDNSTAIAPNTEVFEFDGKRFASELLAEQPVHELADA